MEIENIGDVDAIDVNIYDYFPKELEIYHSIPKGEINGSSIRYFLELLKAGHKRRFEVMFKVSKSAKIGKGGLYLTNIAKAFSKNSESAVEVSATW